MLGFLRKKRARKIYLHEAAHAITAVHHGIPVKHILVYPDNQPDGTIADTELDLDGKSNLDDQSLRALVIIALAGAVIDGRVHINSSYHQFDVTAARDYAGRISEWYSLMDGYDDARLIVDSNWSAITALADALEASDGMITGSMVKEIYQSQVN